MTSFLTIDDEKYDSIIQLLKSARTNHWDFNPLQDEAKALYDAHRALLKKWIQVRIGISDLELYSADPQRLVTVFKNLEMVAEGKSRVTFSPEDVDFLITDHLNLRDMLSMLNYGMSADKVIEFQKAKEAMMDKIIKNGPEGLFGDGSNGE